MERRILHAAHGSAEWRETVRLREAVLRAPLGLAFSADELARESAQLHLALRAGGTLAGGVVLVPPSADAQAPWQLRQMEVAPGFSGQGFGTALVAAAEHELHLRDAERVVLHARETAVAFYARLGYRAHGAVFDEVTIPHRLMRKHLPTAMSADADLT